MFFHFGMTRNNDGDLRHSAEAAQAKVRSLLAHNNIRCLSLGIDLIIVDNWLR